MVEEEGSANSVSRRTMLKRFGIAGAVAWVTPVISSLNTPAYAATSGLCSNGFTCGDTPTPCDGAGCFCSTTDQGTACADGNVLCPDRQTCAAGEGCPAGEVCVINSCCGVPVCLSLCGSARSGAHTAAVSGGMTPIGKR
jgi:hypothetical protein